MRCASATNEPRSRPRTLAVTTARRLPFSRLHLVVPGCHLELSDFAQRHVVRFSPAVFSGFAVVLERNRQALQRLDVFAQPLRQAHQQVEAAITLEQLAGLFPAHSDLDDLLNVSDVEA